MQRHLAVLASPDFLRDPRDDARLHLQRLTACVVPALKPKPHPFTTPAAIRTSLHPAVGIPGRSAGPAGFLTAGTGGSAAHMSNAISHGPEGEVPAGGPGMSQQDQGLVSTPTHLSGSGGGPAGSWLEASRPRTVGAPGSWSPYGLP